MPIVPSAGGLTGSLCVIASTLLTVPLNYFLLEIQRNNFCVVVCVGVHMCQGELVELRENLVGIISYLCGHQGSSGLVASSFTH